VRKKALELAILVAFASGSVACGVIEAPAILALDEGSAIDITVNPDTPNPLPVATVALEGGVVTLMSVEIDLFHLLLTLPATGTIEVTDLLFAGEPFTLFTLPTGAVCTIPDPNGSSGGTVSLDIFDQQLNNASLEFAMDVATAIVVENPSLSGPFPDGLPIGLAVDSEADLTLIELIGLISGSAEGAITVTQPLSERFIVPFLNLEIPLGVDGVLTLTTVDAFPTGPFLDDCIDFLSM
jgi:hypothetical protein